MLIHSLSIFSDRRHVFRTSPDTSALPAFGFRYARLNLAYLQICENFLRSVQVINAVTVFIVQSENTNILVLLLDVHGCLFDSNTCFTNLCPL